MANNNGTKPSNLELFPGITEWNPDSANSANGNGTLSDGEILVSASHNPRLPIGVVVAILMVIGLAGNSLVLYVYQCKMPRTVFSTFVTVLAVLDLATVMVSMPLDVIIKVIMLDNSQSFDLMCKIAHFEVYSTSLASGSVLLLIAVTRYIKVCRPMKPGLSKHQATLLCLLIMLIAMSICTVTFVINGMEKVKLAVGERDYVPTPVTADNITANSTEDVFATTETVFGTTVAGEVSNRTGVLDSGTVGSSTAVGGVGSSRNASASRFRLTEVVEVYICRTNEERKGTVLHYALQAVLMIAFVCIFTSLIILHCRISVAVSQFEQRQSSMRRVSVMSSGEQHNVLHITASMFRIFATITVIFVVSYLPHLVCLIVEKSLFSSGKAMPQATRVVMDLAYNFPYINVLANPFIYGYRSAEFRRHCIDLLYRCFCCKCSSRSRRRYR